ncbi:pepsin/retropepsin-like aspartic protease family protein [Mucilaginibacter arboris]|uniref:Aspartyl protease n=1 Tax=Mucilaginibacter arboris TaxID=2682090 RepID=A0A7K1STD3_9SPHI|nr:hypothetical protein [Mucilaginibacter arboris]MVN20569.1 hypothetical protein [Mucilaginibacter arboris]
MKNKYAIAPQFFYLLFVILVASSCKKDSTASKPVSATPVTLGMYEAGSGSNKRVFIPITGIGTQSVTYYGIFDTGSSGMTIDATGILPASMITSSGIQVTGDSVVNGITVTSQQAVVSYGDKTSTTKEYGNLAYADVTIGDQNGNLTLKRVPIFLYYKIVDGSGTKLAAHSSDVFGVGPGISYANSAIASPLSYYSPGTNLTKGFKLATLNTSSFTSNGTFVAGLLSIGLTSADLSSNGFIMHPLTYSSTGGYSPNIPATITYNGTSTAAQVLFDTGTPSVTIIEDQKATSGVGSLPANSVVTVTTNKGFTYQYTTTTTSNLTAIQNPNNTADYRTIFSIDFFINNEILTDYAGHQIGLKNF